MFKNIIIGILLTASSIFGYLYNEERGLNSELDNINVNLENRLNTSDSLISVRDSMLNIQDSKIDSIYGILDKYKYEKDSIEDKYVGLIDNLINISNDSIAEYIISNFAGNTYYIQKIDSKTFISYEDTTSRDIVRRDLQSKAQNELFKRVSAELAMKDTLIKMQAKKIAISTDIGDKLKEENNKLVGELADCKSYIVSLEESLDRQKRLTIIGFSSTGALIVLLILL